MADSSRRTNTRSSGPRPVETRRSHEPRTSSHHHRDASSKQRDSYHDSHHSRNSKNNSQETSESRSRQETGSAERSSQKLSLDIMGQPPRGVHAGYRFQPSVMISTKQSSSKKHRRPSSVNVNNLVAVATLLAASPNGTLTSVPPGVLEGQKLFDNVHNLPSDYLGRLPQDMRDQALGYVSFPGLTVRRPGTYRLRTTLLGLPEVDSTTGETTDITAVDSEIFRVEGYNNGGYDSSDMECTS